MNEDQDVQDVEQLEAPEDRNEWEDAFKDYGIDKGLGSDDDDKKDDDTEDSEDDTQQGDADDTQDDAQQDADDSADQAQPEADDRYRSLREQRAASREIMADEQAMREDVREKLYGDASDKLFDADGDEIKGIDDVMRLVNPNTGQPFTEDEAGSWLLRAQQHLAQERETREKQVENIASVNIRIRDEAETVKERFGDILAEKPQLAQRLMAEYRKTFKLDESGEVILDAPVSLEGFFEAALTPYAETRQAQSAEASARQAEESEAEKLRRENARLKNRADREDIFSGGDRTNDAKSQESKEWAAAAKEVYG